MRKTKKTIDNLEVGDVIVWGNKHGATQTGKIIDMMIPTMWEVQVEFTKDNNVRQTEVSLASILKINGVEV